MKSSFAERLTAAIQDKESCLVVGLDPILERLPPETFSIIGARASGGEGLTARASAAIGIFLAKVIDIVSDLAVAVKPNTAFFERYGAAGWDCLRQVCASASRAGLLVILDAKRGDIGHTAEAYAEGLLGGHPDTPGPFVDAVTLNPYLGTDSMQPYLRRVVEAGKGVFALVRTSNPSAAEIQDLNVDGKPLHLHVAGLVARWGSGLAEPGDWSSVGAVVGATSPQMAASIRSVLPNAYLLVPGVGAQGGKPEDLRPYFMPDGLGAVVNASRSILFAYEGRSEPWPESIRRACAETREALERVRAGADV